MNNRWLSFVLAVALFFVSGASSLIYQVVWTRLLVLVFGSTTFATATVLTVFMGGLALGSYLAGRVCDRIARPFLWYGLAEGLIGFWALVVPFLFEQAVPIYRLIWEHNHLSLLSFGLLRFLVACVILIIPTTCMGATLPLLARFVTTSIDFVGLRVGTLYAANTFGAVLGAACGGFILLPALGLHATILGAALANFVLMAVVLATGQKMESALSAAAPQIPLEPLVPAISGHSAAYGLVLFCFAASGAAAMIYEVGWTRTLLMIIGSSTYAFTVMLSTFLLGLFVGSFVCAHFVDRLKNPLLAFASLQFLACLLSLISVNWLNYLPWWNLSISAHYATSPDLSLLVRFFLAACCLLPLTLCLGAIFPVVIKVGANDLAAIGRFVGTLYSYNTFGAIAGSFAAGFVLIPLFGVEKTLVLAAMINLALGAIILCHRVRKRNIMLYAIGTTAVALIIWFFFQGSIWDRLTLMKAQAARRSLKLRPFAFHSFQEWNQALHDTDELLFYQDGLSSTVGVRAGKHDQYRTLVTNGHVDASDSQEDMFAQVLLADYPLLWKPDAQDVCVIGWGSGITVGCAAAFPLKQITAVEIEPAVIAASKYFEHVNHKPEEKSLVTLEVNDGRNYLLASSKKFDVIISEPSNPWQAGVCNLFTQEYFDICRHSLKPGGIFALWLQTCEVSPQNVSNVLAALHNVFPYVQVMRSDYGDAIVLASNTAIVCDLAKVAELIKNPAIAADLKKVDIDSPAGLLAGIACAPDGIPSLVKNARPNIDDTNELEYTVGKTYENEFFGQDNINLFQAHAGKMDSCVNWGKMSRSEIGAEMAQIARRAMAVTGTYAQQWVDGSLARSGYPQAEVEALRLAGILCFHKQEISQAFNYWNLALAEKPDDIETLQTRGLVELELKNKEEARKDFLRVLAKVPDNAAARYHMACTYASIPWQPVVASLLPASASSLSTIKRYSGGDEAAKMVLKYLSRLTDDQAFVEKHHDTLMMAGVASEQVGLHKQACDYLRRYLWFEPNNIDVRHYLAASLNNR